MEHILRSGISTILETLYEHRGTPLHLRELIKKSGFSIQGTTRVVNSLVKQGLLDENRLANLRQLKIDYANPQIAGILTAIDLKKVKKLPKLVQSAFEEFCNKYDNQIIILFGSYAKNTYTTKSDIDVLVYVTSMPTISPDVTKINSKYGVKINAVFTDEFSNNSQKHILNTGIPLTNHARFYREYGKNEQFNN